MLPAFVIFFREALEASLIVGIILAYLHRIGRSDQTGSVWLGVGSALIVAAAVAALSFHVIHQYDGSRVQAILEGSTYLVATAMLTYMSFWMKEQSRSIRHELEAKVAAALSSSSVLTMALLAGITVGREGLETAFFMLAIALRSQPVPLLLGALLGIAAGLGVSFWIYRLGRRAPLGLFFNILGVLLLLFGAGLLADAVESFQSIGWLAFWQTAVWHSGRLLSESSALGDILHSLLGYAESPSLLQVSAYLVFLVSAVAAYLRIGRRAGSAHA
ncbi:MAG: FTR1 family protein [Thermaerobacter sp.]|nr:FTR1 family protein [Thermaerobacter sp.]